VSYGASWGVWWGLGLERPAWASLPPALIRDQEQRGELAPGSAAQLGGVIVTKRGRGTLRPELVLSTGPQRLARTGGGTYAELYGARWALGLYRGGPRLYQAQAGVWVDRSDPDALGVLTAAGVRHVALAFDQAARPVFAWEQGAQIYIRQWSPQLAQYVTRGPWAGCDPLLMNDSAAHYDPAESDVLLLHLDADRAQLVARVQRELYAAARPLAALPADAVLDQLVGLPLSLQVLGEAGGAPVALRPELYPLRVRDRLAGDVQGVTGGLWFAVIITQDTGTHAATGDVQGVTGGAWVAVIITRDTGTHAATGDVQGITGGTYAVK